MPNLEYQLITSTPWKEGDEPQDGLGRYDGQHWVISNCIIDLTDWPHYKTDEAIGVTWGSSATFTNCIIRGAGKLVLCGCGDDDKVPVETGKTVIFRNCILEDFSRRGPEVQDSMICQMYDCMISGWGWHEKFDTRAFGSWAHKGGRIYAKNCLFLNKGSVKPWYWLLDHLYHFGQAVNERGFFKALIHRDAWLSGYKRAFTAGPDGYVQAEHCFASKGLVVDNHTSPMSETEALERLKGFAELKKRLSGQLGWPYKEDK